MTNEDKAFLRWQIREKPERTDKDMALATGCTVATVKRYRKALAIVVLS